MVAERLLYTPSVASCLFLPQFFLSTLIKMAKKEKKSKGVKQNYRLLSSYLLPRMRILMRLIITLFVACIVYFTVKTYILFYFRFLFPIIISSFFNIRMIQNRVWDNDNTLSQSAYTGACPRSAKVCFYSTIVVFKNNHFY